MNTTRPILTTRCWSTAKPEWTARDGHAPQSVRNNPQVTRRVAIRCADLLALAIFGERAVMLSTFVSAYDARLAGAIRDLPNALCSAGTCTNLTAGLRIANDLLASVPQGLLRQAWILSDGIDNVETEAVPAQVRRAHSLRINLNTIGFGDPRNLDPDRLRAVAVGTHRGRFVPVETALALDRALATDGSGARKHRSHRGAATVFVIDASGSMRDPMGNASKIEVVRDALHQLLVYKQRMWS